MHDIISDIFNASVAAQRDSAHRIDVDVVKQSNSNGMAYVLEDFLSKWRAVCVHVDFGIWILYLCVLFDASLRLDELRSQSVDAFTVVIIAFKRVAVSDTCHSLESNPTASVSAHSVFVFYRHYFLREIAFIHVKIEAIHRNQFGECYVVSLPLVVRECVSKHKHSLF